MVGGGNNASGCADMYSLDLTTLSTGVLAWTLIGNTPVESAIASEGLSLLTVPMAGCLVSYGGYNGRYHNTVHVYRPEGYVVFKAPQRLGQEAGGPAAAAAATGGGAGIAQSSSAASLASASNAEFERKLGEVEAARKEAAAAKAAVSEELAFMRRQLDSAQAAQAEVGGLCAGSGSGGEADFLHRRTACMRSCLACVEGRLPGLALLACPLFLPQRSKRSTSQIYCFA